MCKEDSDCGGECKDGKCYQSCKDNLDCTYGDQCGNKICVPKRCPIDKDCGPGNKCTSNKCIVGCSKDEGNCPDGKNCIDDYCAIPPGNHLFDLLLNLA